jgi:hypothetical protein
MKKFCTPVEAEGTVNDSSLHGGYCGMVISK